MWRVPRDRGSSSWGGHSRLCGHRLRRHQLAAFLAEEMGQSFDAELLGEIEEIFGPQHQAGAFPGGGVLKQDLAPEDRSLGPGQPGRGGAVFQHQDLAGRLQEFQAGVAVQLAFVGGDFRNGGKMAQPRLGQGQTGD